jgi:hypothetical protein
VARPAIALGLVLGLMPSASFAQGNGRVGTSRVPGAGGTVRHPYFDPVVAAALVQRPVDRSVPLLYLLSANDAAGGIGSGRISGVRPGPEAARRPAEMPRVMSRPGAGAAHYFQRSPAPATGRAGGFGRHNRYFDQNGR